MRGRGFKVDWGKLCQVRATVFRKVLNILDARPLPPMEDGFRTSPARQMGRDLYGDLFFSGKV